MKKMTFLPTKRKRKDEETPLPLIREVSEPKILIIGAGAAGIACATKLIEFGFNDVLIYEAENRIGGRVHTIPFADNMVEMGAQWCHGEKGNVVYELVKDLRLLDKGDNTYYKSQHIRSDGLPLDNVTVQQLQGILERVFEKRFKESARFNGSLGEYMENKFFDISNEEEYDHLDFRVIREFLDHSLKIQGFETASRLEDVSARDYLSYYECEGDYMLSWRRRGFKELFNVMTKAKPPESRLGVLEDHIFFNHVVDRIIWNRKDDLIEVRCIGKNSILVDHVVVTTSVGVLKKRIQLFNPPLPEHKQSAIRNMGFGTVCKIILEFELPFWRKGWRGFHALWSQFDLDIIEETPKSWLVDIFGFYRVKYQPRLLLAWLGGEEVRKVEAMDKDRILKDVMYMLKKFLPTTEINEPINILVSSWSNNPNFNGSYSYPSMSSKEKGPLNSKLAQPITVLTQAPISPMSGQYWMEDERRLKIKPHILFAGEATSINFFSTVHGAVETGWREAKRLAGYYEKGL